MAWRIEDLPYDAMGDFSKFEIDCGGREERGCGDRDRSEQEQSNS